MFRFKNRTIVWITAVVAAGIAVAEGAALRRIDISRIWVEPVDIQSRNLFYGAGGRQHQPRTAEFVFVKEDETGTSPKFFVEDASGQKWKVKLGAEAKPETVASRFVWAAGYYTHEIYFLPRIHVANLPEKLHHGGKIVVTDGFVHNARLMRIDEGEKKVGNWKWSESSFNATREFNGLRVMMTLINNWDLKNINNAIYEKPQGQRIYMVSDLGGTFGTTGITWSKSRWKGNLDAYRSSRFIKSANAEFVSFAVPARPQINGALAPANFIQRFEMEWVGRRIPREDARWMGRLLGRLSSRQIRDAFRAAGYSEREIEGFSEVVQNRIAELKAL
jgi:hypothetical protein